jgi:hypothetical protein
MRTLQQHSGARAKPKNRRDDGAGNSLKIILYLLKLFCANAL